MAPVNIPNLNKWNRPPTSIYENNYGYGINYYQPMIDYIAAKEQGVAAKPPTLPWNNERGLEKYRYDGPIKTYSEADLSRISKEVAEKAKKDLNNFNVTKRSPFSVIATAAATNVSKHVATESVVVKTKKKRTKLERQNTYVTDNALLDKSFSESAVGAKVKGQSKVYKGKSAKAIAQTLLSEGLNNVSEVRLKNFNLRSNFTDNNDYTIRSRRVENGDYEAELSQITKAIQLAKNPPKVCVVRIETDIPSIDESYRQRLIELKETINQFENINTSFVMDRRYRILK
ncbi:PREDICTED: paramyosin, short form-like [Papilio xuthus]|uniref:Paramyosin, short form-like n=1 Tax=Papilio xuthus TaxID=66420 RepID=A0AAJ6ZUD6_PAPXU|nr:PREDICTED: paramyosin, short form-like [Papilio xuthus]